MREALEVVMTIILTILAMPILARLSRVQVCLRWRDGSICCGLRDDEL